MPRVSILLTCYNHLRYLPAALDGIQAQTFRDYEVLALDDGSKDGSREFLLEQEAKGALRCLFNEQNLGTYATLNVGLKEAKGEFIAILNDDDLWGPEKLMRQVTLLDQDAKIGLVHTGGWFIGEDGNRLADPAPLGFIYPSTPTGDVLALEILYNHIITSSVLIRRECIERCGPFDPSFFGSGDWQMWLRIAREFHIGYVDEALAFYRVHGQNASHQKDKINEDDARIREWITTWQGEMADRSAIEPELRSAFAHNWACLGTERTWAGDGSAGRRAYREALKMNPRRLKTYLRWMATYLPSRAFRRLS
ncbi:MAG: glycosyltransferase [Fimbriimonadaceae bacterium]|nr:glycosyltransferase [Fimbriimonadaceae bacterium]